MASGGYLIGSSAIYGSLAAYFVSVHTSPASLALFLQSKHVEKFCVGTLRVSCSLIKLFFHTQVQGQALKYGEFFPSVFNVLIRVDRVLRVVLGYLCWI
jgi:hypothetical protein